MVPFLMVTEGAGVTAPCAKLLTANTMALESKDQRMIERVVEFGGVAGITVALAQSLYRDQAWYPAPRTYIPMTSSTPC